MYPKEFLSCNKILKKKNPEVWAKTNQVQNFSKLTNLVTKANLVPKTVNKKWLIGLIVFKD